MPGPPHSPELNDVAERTNRTISNHVRCSLISSSLPKSFWADALQNTSHAFNSYPCHTPMGFFSPSSILDEHVISSKNLHPFGCLAWYKTPEANRKKLDPKAVPSLLLSYLSDGKGYRLWDLRRRTVVKSRDFLFDEHRFPWGEPSLSTPEPLRVDLPWPKKQDPITNVPLGVPPCPEITRTPTPDLPLLNIQLVPQFDRRLQASIPNVDCDPSPHHDPLAPESSTPHASPPPDRVPPPPEPAPEPAPPRRSSRRAKPPVRLGNFVCKAAETPAVEAPKTWKRLLKSPHKDLWWKAAEE